MKNTLRITIAVVAVLGLLFSLSGCNVFSAMRQNAELAAQTTLLDDPDDATAFEELNAYINAAFDNAEAINEDVSYNADGISVKKDGEEAGLLNDAANTVKGLIMNGNPGKSSRAIENRDDAGLLGKIDQTSALDYEITRNQESEALTDENENELTDENGDVETTIKTVDNGLNFDIKYYTTEITTDENGEENETHTPGEAKVIEAVFGEQADKDTILAEFNCLADYITVSDYTTEYADCRITASVDMSTGEVQSVEFSKGILVKATVIGVGSLADYGEMTVEFTVTKTVSYSFSYPVSEEMP